MNAVLNSTSNSDVVTVTREQFNAMRVAVLYHVFECKDQARECTRCGAPNLATKWANDADRAMALYNELAGM